MFRRSPSVALAVLLPAFCFWFPPDTNTLSAAARRQSRGCSFLWENASSLLNCFPLGVRKARRYDVNSLNTMTVAVYDHPIIITSYLATFLFPFSRLYVTSCRAAVWKLSAVSWFNSWTGCWLGLRPDSSIRTCFLMWGLSWTSIIRTSTEHFIQQSIRCNYQ